MRTTQDRWTRNQSYSQWVAAALARAKSGSVCTLFDSSVPEPRELLRETIVEGVTPDFSKFFTSAFGTGNRFVLDILAEIYGVEREQVLGTTGATGGIALIMRTFARPGDHVLVESPGFDLFRDLSERQGLQCEAFTRVGPRYQLNLQTLDAQIRPDTRLVVLSNLHNPSGMAIEHASMVELARLAERRDILVVVDEVYGGYAGKTARPCDAVAISPNFISVSSLTKIYGLGALRCGWVVGSREVMDTVRDVSARTEFGVSSITHAISAHVLDRREIFDQYSLSVVSAARPVFEEWFTRMQVENLLAGELPEAGCICFPSIPSICNTVAFSDWLARESGLIVAPGECFDAPGHVRIGFAKPVEVLERALAGLADGIKIFRDRASRDTILQKSAKSAH